jgi:hypothetical protein
VAWAALCACSGPLRCCAAEQIAQVVQVGRAQRGLQLGEAGFVAVYTKHGAVYAKQH